MLRFLRIIFKALGIAVVLLLITVICIPVFFKDEIKAKVLAAIDKHIAAEVNFTDISFSSFKNFPHLAITLHDPVVTGINEFRNDTLLFATELSVSFDLKSIINGDKPEINSVHLVDPLLFIRVLPDGKTNYDIVKKDTSAQKTGTQKPFDIFIDEWSIKNGRIIYDDKLQKTYIEVGGLEHSGSGDFKQDISDLDISTKVSDLTFIYNSIPFFKKKTFEADLVMEMNLKDKKFIFKDHSFQLEHFKFAFDGYFQLLENGYLTDIEFVVSETSFKNLLSLLPGFYKKEMEGIETKGEFSCSGFVRGIYDVAEKKMPSFNLDLHVKDAMFKYSHLPKAVEKINFHLVADNPDGHPEHSTLDLKTFHFEMDKNPVHGKIYLKGSEIKHIKADVRLSADLAEIEKFYPLKDLTLKGLLKSEIKVNGKYCDSLKLFPMVDAFLTLDNGHLKTSDTHFYMDSIHLDAELVNSTGIVRDTRINLNKMTFLLDDEPFVMSGTIKNLEKYDYDLKIDGLIDLNKLTQLYPVSNTTVTGTLNFDVVTSGNLEEIELKEFDRLKADGTLEAKDVKYHSTDIAFGIHVDDALLYITPDKIVLDRFKGEFGKSNVHVTGHLFNYIPYLLKNNESIKGDLNVSIDTLDMDEWFPHAISDEDESKAANAVNAPKKPLMIPRGIDFTFDSEIALLEFGKLDIADLKGEIKAKDGVVTLNETGFNALDSKFVLSGDYITKDIQHPVFDLDIDVEKLDINRAYQTFISDTEKAPAEGLFSTKYKLKGELAPDFVPIYSTLTGNGKIFIDSVSLTDMKLFNHIKGVSKKQEFHNPDLHDIVMNTEIKDEKLYIFPFAFKVERFLTEVEGIHSFDNNVEYLIRLSVPPLKKMRIPINISGNTDKPVIKLGKGYNHEDFEKLEE